MRKILRKVFGNQQRKWQVWIAGVGFGLGVLIMLVSVQLYIQIDKFIHQRNLDSQYVIISKKIGLGNTFGISKAEFEKDEILAIRQLDFVEDIGNFTSNQFEVVAYIKRLGFYSELFFESIPNQYLDIQPSNWSWEEGSDIVPVILSKDMLDLYNFGYAMGKSQGLPQISTSTAKLITVNLQLKGIKGERVFQGRIVGFSERIPSILVPENFMRWANRTIGEGKKKNPSRLILKVKNTQNNQLVRFLEEKNYQVNTEVMNLAQAGNVAQMITSVVGIVGILFIILSVIVFLMNFRVILAEATDEIRLLVQLGYTTEHIAKYLISTFAVWIGIILLIIWGMLWLLVSKSGEYLQDVGLNVNQAIEYEVMIIFAMTTFLIIGLNIFSVFRIIGKISGR